MLFYIKFKDILYSDREVQLGMHLAFSGRNTEKSR